MAEQTVTVTPGIMATLSVNMSPGTTIVNNDSVTAVWVSSAPAASPGQGLRIGPLGSLQWSAPGACYAVTDTGATTPVTLSVSNSAVQPVNPADVGAAVAARLLQQGIPNVLLGDLIFNGTVPAVTSKIFTGLSKYASLTISVFSPNSSQLWEFLQQAGGIPTGDVKIPQAIAPASNYALTISLPVQGDMLSIIWGFADPAVQLTIYASNRPQPFQILSANTAPLQMTLNQPFTFPNNYDFPYFITGNGKKWGLHAVITGANSGLLGIHTMSGNADLLDFKGGFAGNDGQVIEKDFIMPAGITKFYFGARTSATYTVVLTLFPGL